MEHLGEAARKAMDLSNEERILKIRNPRWIGYTRARSILDKLDELLVHPKTHRMPNLLIVGSTNNGKTMIVNRFVNKHPAYDNLGGASITIPVMAVQAPPVPDEARFYNVVLEALFAPYKPQDHVSKKQMQVISILRRVNLKILIIDEIHHILAGHMEKQRQFLNVIKYLGNELQIPIVAVGTKDAFRALQTDPQLSNRFEPVILPKWDIGEEYLKLLASFERMLPLKEPSNLTDISLASKLLSMSEGTIGELSKLLNEAAICAIRSKKECITKRLLDTMDWVAPSERKRQADRFV